MLLMLFRVKGAIIFGILLVSIAYGLIAGIISYIILNSTVWLVEKASGNRIRPADKEYKDFWTYKLEGGLLPPWLMRAARRKKDFWREDVEKSGEAAGGRVLEGREEQAEREGKGGVENVRDGSSEEDGDGEKRKL